MTAALSSVEILLRIIGGVGLLLANAFFVATEFALTRVRQFPEEEFQDTPGLRRAWAMTEELEIYLTGCQLGITVASVGFGVVAEPAVAALFQRVLAGTALTTTTATTTVAVLLALGVMNALHLVFGEQAPTYLGVERAKTIAKYCAPIHYIWTKTMSPIITFGDFVAKQVLGLFGVTMTRSWTDSQDEDSPTTYGDLRREIGALLSQGQLTVEERQEVMNALEINQIPITEIMVPRDEVVVLSTTATLDENLSQISEYAYARFPLIGDSLDEFYGVVYVPALLRHYEELQAGDVTLEELASDPVTFDAAMDVGDAIDGFQAARQELAFVIEDDEVIGAVTPTDAFERIVGDLEDPFDVEQSR